VNGIGQAAIEIQEKLNELDHSFCFIGGVAVIYWGTPRSTQDVDLSLVVPLGEERIAAENLLECFLPRIDDAISFAEQSRILLIKASNGVSIDIAFAGFPLEQAMIDRSVICELQPELSLRLACAEDLVVTKAIAGRAQDILDIRGIIDRQGEQLNRHQIRSILQQFCALLETNDPIRIVEEVMAS